MHKIKGTGLLVIKKLILDRGPEAEKKFLEKLTPESRQTWASNTLASSWVEVDLCGEGSILFEGAKFLYPGNPKNALMETGKVMAREGIPRFYKMFIHIPTPEFVMKSVAQMWRMYYAQGEASIGMLNKQHMVFALRQFPDFPPNMRIYMIGYLHGFGELLKLKQLTVSLDEHDPNVWRWEMKWG